MIINYELKAKVIASGLHSVYSKFTKINFQLDKMNRDNDYVPFIPGFHNLVPEQAEELLMHDLQQVLWYARWEYGTCLFNNNDHLIQECQKINNASCKRVKRLSSRIQALLKSPCLFLTLTFDEPTMAKYSPKELHEKVIRYLKKLAYNVSYVANIDYGEIGERLHYHAIVQVPYIDFNSWTYGNLDVQVIKNPNSKAMAKYITKLTNHAIKETCKGCRVIYSRNKKDNSKSLIFSELGK